MMELLEALITYMRTPANGLRAMLGTYQNEYGPFLGGVKEGVAFPYTVLTIFGVPNEQGFASTYVDKPVIRFDIFTDNDTDLITYTKLLRNSFDTLSGLTVTNGICRHAVRKTNPVPMMLPNDGKGKRIYHCYLDYEFRVQQVKGT